MTARAAWRVPREPLGVFGLALLGSAALWGKLWVTAPRTHGVCGCGDPALFQWFLAWPAHALATGHSLVFSRDLFHPGGVNLLANTSVLGLGVPLAPVTWLGGPVLTENLALLLAVPVAALTMNLLLRRVSRSAPARIVLALFYGFSPYVVANLTEAHLMLAWIGILPLIALGLADVLASDEARVRRGRVVLIVAVVWQFFVSTELLLLAALVGLVVLGTVALTTWLPARLRGERIDDVARIARRAGLPLGVAVLLLAAPAAYALLGPQSLKGNVWGAGFNVVTGGSSLLDLVRPHAATGLGGLTGYSGTPVVQPQLVGWGIVAVVAIVAIWRRHDVVARTAAITCVVCLAFSLSPYHLGWAPWEWLAKLPLLDNVVQFRIAVFALFAAIVVVARGVDAMGALGTPGVYLAAASLGLAVLPVLVPELTELPLRTVPVAVPAWWRATESHGVVLAYPFPGNPIESPLAWQAHGAFAVSLIGGTGPQGTPARAGADRAAFALLDELSQPYPFGPTQAPMATASSAAVIRAMLARDGVTEVVVPTSIKGGFLAAGRPSVGATAYFTQVLGEPPAVVHHAWVFAIGPALAPWRIVLPAGVARCEAAVSASGPASLGPCLLKAAT